MNAYEAKRGFITFLATLLIATGIFTSVYFAVNSLNSKARLNSQVTATQPKQELTEKPSVFGDLAQSKPVSELTENGEDSKADVNTAASKETPTAQQKDGLLALTEVTPTTASKEQAQQVLGASDTDEATSGAVPTTGANTLTGSALLGFSLIIS
ncbi:hypothetical protein HY419_01945, partial [candidate division WWE3 bacterium]|nr:hypothetical protein [candidate division WWE3 bacterium]